MWSYLTRPTTDARSSLRAFVNSGLGGEDFVGEHDNEAGDVSRPPPPGNFNWRMVAKEMNKSSTLKLICCPSGCNSINGNFTLFPQGPGVSGMGSPQAYLVEVSGDRLEVDLLSRGIGHEEAAELVEHLPSAYKTKCKDLVGERRSEIVV